MEFPHSWFQTTSFTDVLHFAFEVPSTRRIVVACRFFPMKRLREDQVESLEQSNLSPDRQSWPYNLVPFRGSMRQTDRVL